MNQLDDFGKTAESLARNPLGIIALFIVLIYGFASIVVVFGSNLQSGERVPLVLVVFRAWCSSLCMAGQQASPEVVRAA